MAGGLESALTRSGVLHFKVDTKRCLHEQRSFDEEVEEKALRGV